MPPRERRAPKRLRDEGDSPAPQTAQRPQKSRAASTKPAHELAQKDAAVVPVLTKNRREGSSSSAEQRKAAEKAADAAAEAERRSRAEQKEQRRVEKAAEAARKKEAAAAKKAAAEKRRTEQREQQEQREREREDAEMEAMLRQIPPSVLDGSTAGDNFRSSESCATAVVKEHKQFTRALAPLHGEETVASEAFFAAWLTGLIGAYAAGRAARDHRLLVFQLDGAHARQLALQRWLREMHVSARAAAKGSGTRTDGRVCQLLSPCVSYLPCISYSHRACYSRCASAF